MNNKRTSTFLMANLGAEVSRIFSAKDAHDEKRMLESFERAQNILQEIMGIPDMKAGEVEVSILRDAICDITKNKPVMSISKKNLMAYFTPFALRLMTYKSL